jgi:hypothetical protein
MLRSREMPHNAWPELASGISLLGARCCRSAFPVQWWLALRSFFADQVARWVPRGCDHECSCFSPLRTGKRLASAHDQAGQSSHLLVMAAMLLVGHDGLC